jgi:hypothetical protein
MVVVVCSNDVTLVLPTHVVNKNHFLFGQYLNMIREHFFVRILIIYLSFFTEASIVDYSKLDSVPGCSTDNWGMPHQTTPPFRSTYDKEIKSKCDAQFSITKPISDLLENAMVNFYANNEDFAAFTGVDLVPENHDLFSDVGTQYKKRLDATIVAPKSLLASNCETTNDDGSRWTITRIGPFRTTGGYDWTQVGWENLWDIKGKLEEYPEGIYAVEQFSAPVTRDGTRIGNPPIHVHHIHIGPMPGVRQHLDMLDCVLSGNQCYNPTRVMEHHGDYQDVSTSPGQGLDILTESIPLGYGKLLTYPLGLEGDINDERALNSEPLEWYYELGVRWVPLREKDGTLSTIKPINFHNFAGPGNYDRNNQHSWIFTYQSPTDHDSLFW